MKKQISMDYYNMSQDEREFAQILLFMQVLEFILEQRDDEQAPISMYTVMQSRKHFMVELQQYEHAWLYKDTMERYADDIAEIDAYKNMGTQLD